jgi:surface antigen
MIEAEESRRLQIGSEVYISGTQEADANINIAGNDVEVEHPVLESEGLEESTTLEEPSFIEQSELSAISSGSDFYRNAGTNPFAASYQGQCTWFSYGRMLETDLLPDNTQTARAFLGNAGTWEADAHRLGLPVLDKPEPEKSYLMVFPPKVRGAGEVGHVAFLEEVFSNGDIRISESNWNGQEIAERTIKAGNYSGIKFVELAEK